MMFNRFVVVALAFFLMISPALAWHCVDSDITEYFSTPTTMDYYGDNGVMGGNTTGWLNVTSEGIVNRADIPAGCTGNMNGNISCPDFCDGTTFREFYCSERKGHYPETVIVFHDYLNSAQCSETPNVPEFGVGALVFVLIASVVFVSILRKNL